ncbi:hypothetical protein [Streptosporangium amethystogenes]|uniref:hypothetical protein n=1 Tax=Streptosporangium amethystogenes TaxID=2002 RepID=UPI0004CB7EE6|nr:hypothetical protein [Streptosporangium amethystogenes]
MTETPGEIAILIARYDRNWLISEAAGGGYYAVRRHSLSEGFLGRNDLSNMICVPTLGEMARRLAAERKRENRL